VYFFHQFKDGVVNYCGILSDLKKHILFNLFSFVWNIDNTLCEFRLITCITAHKIYLPLRKGFGLQDRGGFVLQVAPYASQNQGLYKMDCLENAVKPYKLLNNTMSALGLLSFYPMINAESLPTTADFCHRRIYGSILSCSSTFPSNSKNFEVG